MNPNEKGRLGELLVRSALQSAFPSARLFSNLIIPAADGLTQIDHVLVTSAGVFVIEVKKYAGDILGARDAALWKQCIGHHTSEFQNPLHQNARHVSALRGQLGLRDSQLHSIVVFVGRAGLLRPVPNVITTIAVGCPKLIDHIRAFPEERMTDGEMAEATRLLIRIQAAGFTEEDLLRSIRERKARTREVAWKAVRGQTFPSRTINHRTMRKRGLREDPLLQAARWVFRNF